MLRQIEEGKEEGKRVRGEEGKRREERKSEGSGGTGGVKLLDRMLHENNPSPSPSQIERPYLEPVGEDDVGVHGTHVQMVNHRVLQPGRGVSQRRQLLLQVSTNLANGKTTHLELHL